MDYLMGDDDLEGSFEDEGVVGAAAMRRAAARRGSALRLPAPPAWRRAVAPGVHEPGQGLEMLPFRAENGTGILTQALRDLVFIARPQRPFRGERALIIVARSVGAEPVIPVLYPGIFIGTSLLGADLGDTPLEAFQPTAFGVRMSFPQATPGMEVKVPISLRGPAIPVDANVTVSITVFGRTIR